MNNSSLEILAAIKATSTAFKNYEHQLDRYTALARGYADRVDCIQEQALEHRDWQQAADELASVNRKMCTRIHNSSNDELVEMIDEANKELAARTATGAI